MFIAPVGSGDKHSNLARVSKDANARDFARGRRLGSEDRCDSDTD
jgi:hypothetical protein